MAARRTNTLLLLEQWSRGVAEISAARGTDSFIPALQSAVCRLVEFDFTMVFAYRNSATPLVLGDTLDQSRHRVIAHDYVASPFLLDPFYRLVSEGTQTGCFRLHAVAPDHFRRSAYFRAHYGRTGIGDEIGMFFDLRGGLIGVASFARWNTSPPVLRAELDILQAIQPAVAALCIVHWSNLCPLQDQPPVMAASVGLANGPAACRTLSAREAEIVTMVLQGHSTESIALSLDIAPGTVKIHRKNIYRKMQISSQAELFSVFMGFTVPSVARTLYPPRDMAPPAEIVEAHTQR
jgi:DNA-binding CsgD family transcriptional regulator